MEKNRTVNGQTTIIMITVSLLEHLGMPSSFNGYAQNSIGYTQNITIFYPRKHRFCIYKIETGAVAPCRSRAAAPDTPEYYEST